MALVLVIIPSFQDFVGTVRIRYTCIPIFSVRAQLTKEDGAGDYSRLYTHTLKQALEK